MSPVAWQRRPTLRVRLSRIRLPWAPIALAVLVLNLALAAAGLWRAFFGA